MNRRTFLKLSAFTGAALGAGPLTGAFDTPAALPLRKKTQNDYDERSISTSCLICPARCAIRVKVMSGKAIKVIGNPLSRDSDGKICPRAHVGLQVLYDPDRISSPLLRTTKEKGQGIDPRWAPITWGRAFEEVTIHLRRLREKAEPHRLLLFSGLNSVSGEDVISRFAAAFGTPNLISGDGLDSEAERSGHWMADGHYTHGSYDLDHTRYILAFGADLLESGKPLTRILRKWGKLRREQPNRAKVVVINPRYSLTAAKSDEWIPIQPGTDAALALAIAHILITEKLYDQTFVHRWTEGFNAYKNLVLSQYRPSEVSEITGIPPETIQRTAREFSQAKPAIALSGMGAVNWPGGAHISHAVFCLNALVGSIDVPGGVIYQVHPKYREMGDGAPDEIARSAKIQPCLDFRGTDRFPMAKVVTNQIPESILEDAPYPAEMAIGFNSNFNMFAPGTQRWDKALSKLPYFVHISPFISEMAMYADLVLPSTTYLEEWGYDHSLAASGSPEARIKQPVVTARGESRSAIDILFELARRLGGRIAQSFSDLGGDSKGFVQFRTATLKPWEEFLRDGVWKGPDYQYKKYQHLFNTPSKKFEFCSGNFKALMSKMKRRTGDLDGLPRYEEPQFLGQREKYPLILLPYQPLMVIENGSQNYPWAQEIFLPMQGVGWETLAEINSETANALNLRDGQEVWVESPFQKMKVKVKCSEGVHPEVVAVSIGQGHSAYGRWQKGMSVNPNEILGVDYDTLSGQSVFFNTRVRVYKA